MTKLGTRCTNNKNMFLLHCQSPAGFVQQSTKHRFNYSVWYADLIPPVSIITKTNYLKVWHAKLMLLQSQSSQFQPRQKPWEQWWKQHDVEALSSLKNNISHRAKVSCQTKVQTSVLLPHVSSQEIGWLVVLLTSTHRGQTEPGTASRIGIRRS